VFDSPANVRVLRVLVRHGGLMTTDMIIQQTFLTRMTVLAAVSRLSDAGLVVIAGGQRQRVNQFDDSGPLASAIKALFARESAHYQAMLKTIREMAQRLGAEAVWLYGSVARGLDRPGSDLDIAVVCADEERLAISDALRDQLDIPGPVEPSIAVFGRSEVRRLDRERDPLWRAIKQDAVVVMGASPEAYLAKLEKRKKQSRDPDRKRKARRQ
jgi:predicted nucleotidyltransferase